MPDKWKMAQLKAAKTARWAVTLTKQRVSRTLARTRWQLVTFCGPAGGESVGIVDLLAVRKDHRKPKDSLSRGDALQIILIQVKGGAAPMPTVDEARRLQTVARLHRCTRDVLTASWKKGRAPRFYRLRGAKWTEIEDVDALFR